MNQCLVRELKDFETFSITIVKLNLEGIVSCKVKYSGGLNVLLFFETMDECENFLKEYLDSWEKLVCVVKKMG